MKDEIAAAVTFLIKLICSNNPNLPSQQTTELQNILIELLTDKFQNHWHPDKPTRGQAFRCIRLNGINRNDSVLELSCKRVGLSYVELKFPVELTLWIDPEEVTARFGEHKGSYCILAKFKGGNKENFVNQINIPELEQKSLERARQATLELMLSRKKKFNKTTYTKTNGNQLNNLYSSNGSFDLTSSPGAAAAAAAASANSFYGSYYASSPKYYSSSPPHSQSSQSPVSHHGGSNGHSGSSGSQSGLYSPSRMSPYRQNNLNGSFSSMSGVNNKFVVRNFHSSSLNSTGLVYEGASTYQTDRYHWMNKSIVKA